MLDKPLRKAQRDLIVMLKERGSLPLGRMKGVHDATAMWLIGKGWAEYNKTYDGIRLTAKGKKLDVTPDTVAY